MQYIIENKNCSMEMNEGSLCFEFLDGFKSIKFDNTSYYRNRFNHLPESKGVDFLAVNKNSVIMIEVKDCLGYEEDNRWRTAIDNKKIDSRGKVCGNTDEDTFDIEISKKVAMSIACIIGAARSDIDDAKDYKKYTRIISECDIRIIFLLEGNFSTPSRPKTAIMKQIKDSIHKKLSWLKCKIFVEDIEHTTGKYFHVKRIKL